MIMFSLLIIIMIFIIFNFTRNNKQFNIESTQPSQSTQQIYFYPNDLNINVNREYLYPDDYNYLWQPYYWYNPYLWNSRVGHMGGGRGGRIYRSGHMGGHGSHGGHMIGYGGHGRH